MATPTDTTSTYDAIGNREDLINDIYVVFSNRALPSVYGAQPIVLSEGWVVCGFPWDPFGQHLN